MANVKVKVSSYPRGTKFYYHTDAGTRVDLTEKEADEYVRSGQGTVVIDEPFKEPTYVSHSIAHGNLRRVAGENASFELSDILEDVSPGTVRWKVQENLTYLLKREKMLSKEMIVVIPEGAYNWQIEESTGEGEQVIAKHGRGTQSYFVLEDEDSLGGPSASGRFEGDFEVFAPEKGAEEIIAEGHVEGQLSGGMLVDIEALITRAR